MLVLRPVGPGVSACKHARQVILVNQHVDPYNLRVRLISISFSLGAMQDMLYMRNIVLSAVGVKAHS